MAIPVEGNRNPSTNTSVDPIGNDFRLKAEVDAELLFPAKVCAFAR